MGGNVNTNISANDQNPNPIPYQAEIQAEMIKQLQQAGDTENFGNMSFSDVMQAYRQKFVTTPAPNPNTPQVPATGKNANTPEHINWFGTSSYIAAMSSLQAFWKTTQNEKNFERQKTFTTFMASWASTEDAANYQVQIGELTKQSYDMDAVNDFTSAALTGAKAGMHFQREASIASAQTKETKDLNAKQTKQINEIDENIKKAENPGGVPGAGTTKVYSPQEIADLKSQRESLEASHAQESQNLTRTQYEKAQSIRAGAQWQDLGIDGVQSAIKGGVDLAKANIEMSKAKDQAEQQLTEKVAQNYANEADLSSRTGAADTKTEDDIQELLPTLARKYFFSRPI